VVIPYGCARQPAAALRTALRAGSHQAAPPGGGAERRGGCLSRMVFAHHGAPRTQADRVAGNLFGGADFLKESFPYSLRKIGGDRKPGRRSACAGVVCAMSEREGSSRCLDAYNAAAQGDRIVFRAAAGERAEPRRGGRNRKNSEGEALRRGNVSAGDGSGRRGFMPAEAREGRRFAPFPA
jgi:hypothetical protein